ncbi:hypothetical protein DFH11DRAFT_1582827 [Phellopilus nigrolimitatus]|nr:hypothetical protein DFH11DRAFT_1582827 [Phellopilus nigrolimitatus]
MQGHHSMLKPMAQGPGGSSSTNAFFSQTSTSVHARCFTAQQLDLPPVLGTLLRSASKYTPPEPTWRKAVDFRSRKRAGPTAARLRQVQDIIPRSVYIFAYLYLAYILTVPFLRWERREVGKYTPSSTRAFYKALLFASYVPYGREKSHPNPSVNPFPSNALDVAFMTRAQIKEWLAYYDQPFYPGDSVRTLRARIAAFIGTADFLAWVLRSDGGTDEESEESEEDGASGEDESTEAYDASEEDNSGWDDAGDIDESEVMDDESDETDIEELDEMDGQEEEEYVEESEAMDDEWDPTGVDYLSAA